MAEIVVSLCSVFQMPSYEPTVISFLLTWDLPKLAYLSMLSIFELTQTTSNEGQLNNKKLRVSEVVETMTRKLGRLL